ncbi:carboxypeptidase regulatory-like domain-containing protein [Hymenobacter terricola]|uniref:carboxypeptidase regulatory-like domain-containing protein n=1 Tax=Hymenobacter terricola TaxID=2819236 RepID=UPI001B304E84|nr:carboxypeptidase regulatory-like domain-containing protein [Hymenobacter terricola]
MLLVRLLWVIILGVGALPGAAQPGQPLRTYRGLVTDTNRRPLVGASVLVKGTRTAVTTNSEGQFLLALPAGAYELLVDYPGYISPPALLGPTDSVITVMLRSTRPRATRR